MIDRDQDIKNAVDTLRKGGVIAYPTDTVWGIGCDATCSEAVKKVFEIKKRSDAKALITLVSSDAALERVVPDVPEVAWQLIEASDRPVTIVYDHGVGVAPEVLAADGSIGVRLTRDPFCVDLCQRLRRPLISTSANVSGQPSPAVFADISPEVLEACDYVCQWRRDELPTGQKPSMVIKISDGGLFKILRK